LLLGVILLSQLSLATETSPILQTQSEQYNDYLVSEYKTEKREGGLTKLDFERIIRDEAARNDIDYWELYKVMALHFPEFLK